MTYALAIAGALLCYQGGAENMPVAGVIGACLILAAVAG